MRAKERERERGREGGREREREISTEVVRVRKGLEGKTERHDKNIKRQKARRTMRAKLVTDGIEDVGLMVTTAARFRRGSFSIATWAQRVRGETWPKVILQIIIIVIVLIFPSPYLLLFSFFFLLLLLLSPPPLPSYVCSREEEKKKGKGAGKERRENEKGGGGGGQGATLIVVSNVSGKRKRKRENASRWTRAAPAEHRAPPPRSAVSQTPLHGEGCSAWCTLAGCSRSHVYTCLFSDPVACTTPDARD